MSNLIPKFLNPWRTLLTNRSSGSWGNRGQGNEILSGLEKGLSFVANIGDHVEDGINHLIGLIPGGNLSASEFVENQRRSRQAGNGGQYVTVKGDTVQKPRLNMTFPPDITPARIAKLTSLGWKADEARSVMISPKGEEFVFHNNKLMSVESMKNDVLAAKAVERNAARAKAAVQKEKDLALKFEDFRKESGLDFSVDNWQSLGGGHKMTPDEISDYTTKAFPSFVESYRQLVKDGKLINSTNGIQVLHNGQMVTVPKTEAMKYVINNSPLGKALYWDPTPMVSGIPLKYVSAWETGVGNLDFPKWANSNPIGASYYSGKYILPKAGLSLHLAPVTKLPPTIIIKPGSSLATSYNYYGRNPVGTYLSTTGFSRTPVPIIDKVASSKLNTLEDNPVKGIFSVIGSNIPVKSWFGGSGLYRTDPKNLYKAFKSLATPVTLGVTAEELLNKKDK